MPSVSPLWASDPPPPVPLIDADVPNHSGYGVLTYLREEVGSEFANVVLMTSSDRDDVRRRVGSPLTVVAKNEAAEEIERRLR